MKRIIILFIVLFWGSATYAQSGGSDCELLLQSGNAEYNKGNYEKAAKMYKQLQSQCGENFGGCSSKLKDCNRKIKEDAAYKNCTTVEACDAYLQSYPQCRYADQVRQTKSDLLILELHRRYEEAESQRLEKEAESQRLAEEQLQSISQEFWDSFGYIRILFDIDKDVPRIENAEYFNVIARELNNNQHIELVIVGYPSQMGPISHNRDLALRRAKSVRHYLIEEMKINPLQLKVEELYETDTDYVDISEAHVAIAFRVRILH